MTGQEREALEAALDMAQLPWGWERGACVAAFEAGYRAALAAREDTERTKEEEG